MEYKINPDFDLSALKARLLSTLAAGPKRRDYFSQVIAAPAHALAAALFELHTEGAACTYWLKNSLGMQEWVCQPKDFPTTPVMGYLAADSAGISPTLANPTEEEAQRAAAALLAAEQKALADAESHRQWLIRKVQEDEQLYQQLEARWRGSAGAGEIAQNIRSRAGGFKGEDRQRMLDSIPAETEAARRRFLKSTYYSLKGRPMPEEFESIYLPLPGSSQAEKLAELT